MINDTSASAFCPTLNRSSLAAANRTAQNALNTARLASSLVFVAGPLRSGSTLMTLMLDRHSSIKNPGEFDFLFDAFGVDGGLAAAQAMSSEGLDDFYSDDRGYLSSEKKLGPAAPVPQRLHGLVSQYAEGVPCLALSVHRNFVTAHEIFPQARFIHILRDARDCAKSAVAACFAGNVFHGLEPWVDSEASWDRLRPRLTPEQFIEVRYEELVAQPERVLSDICKFLGLPYEPQMLDLSSTTYEPPSPRFANQWRRSMSARDIALVEARVGSMMAARGYELVSKPPRKVSSWTRWMLSLQNTASRHRNGLRTYGVSNWTQDVVARHLGLRGLLRATRLKMYPIKAKTLK
jgi:hypothetical protein